MNSSVPGVFDGASVRKSELGELRDRRRAAGLADCDSDSDLVGLALSGGGLRSGAFCLGVIQAFLKRDTLRFVDYLSTVSGGGYAGAHLSSSMLQCHQTKDLDDKTQEESPPSMLTETPITEQAGGRQPPRMLKFIRGGKYLRRTGEFLNRYIAGLLLIWTFILSGLVAVASLGAWSFRNLDNLNVRLFLAALGFDDDLRLAFFPAFVLAVLWVLAWAVSLFRDRSRAQGIVARYIMYALLIAIGTAFAALIGTGDISVLHFLGFSSLSVPGSVKVVLFGAIAGALLPYVSPRRLLRSGMSPKNTAEKYTFFIATRGLLIGVPFAMFALLAREDISGWNEARDHRLTPPEIADWSAASPVWRGFTLKDQPSGLIEKKRDQLVETQLAIETSEIDFEDYRTAGNRYRNLGAGSQHFPTLSFVEDDVPFDDVKLSFSAAWLALLRLALPRTDEFDNPLLVTYEKSQDESDLMRSVTSIVNNRLKRTDYYREVLPQKAAIFRTDDGSRKKAIQLLSTTYWPDVSRYFSKDDKLTGELWAHQVLNAYRQCELLEQEHKRIRKIDEANSGSTKETRTIRTRQLERETLASHRQLLKSCYGDLIRDKSTVYSVVVLLKDQETRLSYFWWSLLIFLAAGCCLDLNVASWHGFYKQRLSETWIDEVPGAGRQIPLAQLDTTAVGAPYHLISACNQTFGRQSGDDGRRRSAFLFSKLFCGCDRFGYNATHSYMNGNYMLEDAIAVSGGAVTPMQSDNPLILALFFLFNVRLGQWLQNPSQPRDPNQRWALLRNRFVPFRILPQLFRSAEDRSVCFVSDGGHFENLGIYPLLQRRCRLIIAFDAGQDGNFCFEDFNRLKQYIRMTAGIQIESCFRKADLSLDSLQPRNNGHSRSHYVIGRILYPDSTPEDPPAWLVYAKMSLTGDEAQEILAMAKSSEFPHDPTSDQFYDSRRFDAYRHLGQHIAEDVLSQLPDQAGGTGTANFINSLVGGPAQDYVARATDLPDTEVAQWIAVLEDPGADDFEKWYAAREIAGCHETSDRALRALVECLFSDEPSTAAVGRRCLAEIGPVILPLLHEELESNMQSRLIVVIDAMKEVIKKSGEADEATVTIASRRLQELSRMNRLKRARTALEQLLELMQDMACEPNS